MTGSYPTAASFKQALEQRLRNASTSGVDMARRRQLPVFDRFLARTALEFGDAVTLKGGLALELRTKRARTTRDVDLLVVDAPRHVLQRLQLAGRRDLGDYLSFLVRPHDRHPEIANEGVRFDGLRFQAECRLAGKIYGNPFGVDVAFDDPVEDEPDLLLSGDALEFVGIRPSTLRVFPIEHHIAEKIHAFTMPRNRPNSRVKDLPDLALLASIGPVQGDRLAAAIERTFEVRGTHAVPHDLPPPPASWETAYAAIALEDRLAWRSLGDAYEASCEFLNPVLAGAAVGRWDPKAWRWVA